MPNFSFFDSPTPSACSVLGFASAAEGLVIMTELCVSLYMRVTLVPSLNSAVTSA